MKLQLTKSKTIDVKMPWERAAAASAEGVKGVFRDVVGLAVGGDDGRGVPAVRLVHRKAGWEIAACGFVPAPPAALPQSWDEASKVAAWSLPGAFQAPAAAIAVCSEGALLRQTAPDALSVETAEEKPAAGETAVKKKLGVRRAAAAAPAEPEKPAQNAAAEPVKAEPGVPYSQNGMRLVHLPMAEEEFVLQSGLPEYQLKWAAHLFPEGYRPTAASVQSDAAAALSALAAQPEFVASDGTAVAVFVMRRGVYFVAYRGGRPVLLRKCPEVAGYAELRAAVKSTLGLEDSMVESVMDDNLIDPLPAMEPFLRVVMRQLELSLDYLERRYGMEDAKVFLMGLEAGARYWCSFAQDNFGLSFVVPDAFSGFALGGKLETLTVSESQAYLAALGAAMALAEVGQ